MTQLEEILSRALLVDERVVPRDVTSSTTPSAQPATEAGTPGAATAAEDLRVLCETLVTHTPAAAVTAFVTEQLPEPRSALILACVLQLTEADDGARFWWQYAAGAGQSAAAYCLYLHHLSLGEEDVARWWRKQSDEAQAQAPLGTKFHRDDVAALSLMLPVLRRLTRHISRPRSSAVAELMNYMPTAVAVGYLREPDMEVPVPGPSFACEIRTRLEADTCRFQGTSDLPERPKPQPGTYDPPYSPIKARRQVGETATR